MTMPSSKECKKIIFDSLCRKLSGQRNIVIENVNSTSFILRLFRDYECMVLFRKMKEKEQISATLHYNNTQLSARLVLDNAVMDSYHNESDRIFLRMTKSLFRHYIRIHQLKEGILPSLNLSNDKDLSWKFHISVHRIEKYIHNDTIQSITFRVPFSHIESKTFTLDDDLEKNLQEYIKNVSDFYILYQMSQ